MLEDVQVIGKILEIKHKTGIFSYPLFLCSVIGVAVFIKEYWQLRDKNILPKIFLDGLYDLLGKGKIKDARNYCDGNESSISRIAVVAIESRNFTKEHRTEELERAGHNEVFNLGKHIEVMGVISTISTLLGLLGTIWGMIKIFSVIATQDVVNPPALAGGISEALYTTAFGLLIAITTFLGYKFISARYEEFIILLEQESIKIMEVILESDTPEET